MELTINNLIKMVIAALVIVVVIVGIYFAMSSYIIPYFKGIGFGGEEVGGGIVGEAGICEGKDGVGSVDSKGYFIDKSNKKTDIYFLSDDSIKKVERRAGIDRLKKDSVIGRVFGYKIEIFNEYKKGDAKILDGALIGGNQICEP